MNEQYGLTVENLLNVLPDVLRQDEKMLALATGVAEILTARPAEIEQNMLNSPPQYIHPLRCNMLRRSLLP